MSGLIKVAEIFHNIISWLFERMALQSQIKFGTANEPIAEPIPGQNTFSFLIKLLFGLTFIDTGSLVFQDILDLFVKYDKMQYFN